MYGLIVHGGAWDIPDELVDAHIKGVRKAMEIGLDILKMHGSAEDAVDAVISYMEDDTTFDAGKGSFLNRDGKVELDAIMYHGTKRCFGSCMGVKHVKNPIKLAHALMNDTEITILTGRGAEQYAKAHGLRIVPNSYFVIERELNRWHQTKTKKIDAKDFFHHGTVGAVALDTDGNIVAGTSTGGTPNKHPGRVGDTPIPGAGAFATPMAGASATGYGEAILRTLLTYDACVRVEQGKAPEIASSESITDMHNITGMFAGVIVLTKNGKSGFAYNTPRMARAYLKNGRIVAEV